MKPGSAPYVIRLLMRYSSALLAALGLLLDSRFLRSPSNPVLRILLRAFASARDALLRIA
jgi:hypothetical protein